MTQPVKPESKLADSSDNPQIGERGASVTATTATQSAAPAGGTGATAGAYDTAANRDLAIASINAARTDIAALIVTVDALISRVEAHGLIADN